MNRRLASSIVLLVLLAVVVGFDLRARQALRAVSADQNQVAARLAGLTTAERQRAEKIAATRTRLAERRKSTAIAENTAPARTEVSASSGPTGGRMSSISESETLRELRVRAFVGQERLKFAAVLRQLGLTVEQLTRFDRIEAEYQEAVLDLTSAAKAEGVTNPKEIASVGRDIAATRDARLRELLGEGYAVWEEASRDLGARQTVAELLQQTFQSSGAPEIAQVDALTAIMKRRAQAETGARYDWDGIAADAANVLSGPRLEAFRAAVAVRSLADKMNRVAGRR